MAEDEVIFSTSFGGLQIASALQRSKYDMNDLGNARRLCDMAGGLVKYVEELKCWIFHDGLRWTAKEGDAFAVGLTQKVAAGLLDEVKALYDANSDELSGVYGPKFTDEMRTKRAGELYGWAIKTGNSDRASGMLKQARGLMGSDKAFNMRAQLGDFDTDKMAYHCANGTLHFRIIDGKAQYRFEKGHRPADHFMQIANFTYDPDAKCPYWLERLNQLHDDPEQRTAIKRIYGMTLTGLISDQAFYVFQGKGNDGKSMTNDIIAEGHSDYFRSASPQTFLEGKQRNGSDHQSDVVRLKGDIRMVVADEPKKGSTWDGERIKQVTGSKVTARAPNAREEETFIPHWNLIIECNPLPKAPSDDRGFRRRFKLYPWLKAYGVSPGLNDEPPHIVRERLLNELSGILNWMIEGALEWLDTGHIPEPEMSKRAMASFWATSSAMGEWISACCDLSDPDAHEQATPLYQNFRQYCIDRGDKEEHIITQTRFGTLLNEAQVYSGDDHSTGKKVRRGIRLKSHISSANVGLGYDDDLPL